MAPRSPTSLAKVSFLSLKKLFGVSPSLSLSLPEMIPRQAIKFCSVVFILKVTSDQYKKSEVNTIKKSEAKMLYPPTKCEKFTISAFAFESGAKTMIECCIPMQSVWKVTIHT